MGGVNCFSFVNGECVSRMASGLRWQDYIGVAVACPQSFPHWTKIIFEDGTEKFCLDFGGAIVENADGTFWIDELQPNASVPFGTVINVRVVFP